MTKSWHLTYIIIIIIIISFTFSSLSALLALSFQRPPTPTLARLQNLESFSFPVSDEILGREPDWPSPWLTSARGVGR